MRACLGLALVIDGFLKGQDGPLVLGAVGALVAATLAVFTGREWPGGRPPQP